MPNRRCCFIIAAILLVSAGCALPGRDNANDPQNAPVAKLAVVDFSVPNPVGFPAACLALSSAGVVTSAA